MKVLFVSSGNSQYDIVPFIKSQGVSIEKEGVELDYFTVKGKGILGYLKNIKILKKQIIKSNYDIIHAHYGLTGLLTVLTFPKKPIVLSVMGSDAYGSFDASGRRVKSSYLIMFLTQITLIFVKAIIVKSKNIYNIVPYKKKTYIIPNGINFEVFKPVGQVNDKKNILFLADPKNPRKNIKLFDDAVRLLGFKVNIIKPYPISHFEFPKYLNNASVFVLTSYNEGSPNVIKEAMACNVPIVSTDVGDVKEVIGKTEGCYITSFDPEDVAEKIKLALEYGKRTTGREDIKHLESSNIAKKIIKIYETVLKN